MISPASNDGGIAESNCAELRPVINANSARENDEPRTEATRNKFNPSSGSRLSRRSTVRRKLGGGDASRASARPSRTSRAPSPASARTNSITNSGFPPVPASCSSRRGPGGRPATSPARSATSSMPNGPRATCAAPRASSSATAPSTSTPCDPRRTVANNTNGSAVRRRTIDRTTRRVNGSAHCRSSNARTTGSVKARSSTTSTTASTISHPPSTVPRTAGCRPPDPDQQTRQLRSLRIRPAPL